MTRQRGNMDPTHYQICRKLVIDTSDPEATFDSEGVCNHYHEFQRRTRTYWQTGKAGTDRLNVLVSEIRRSGRTRQFDCILGMSGGADSSYMLHKAVTEHGLRPLVFHVDAGWNTELAVHNIERMVSKLGLELYTEVIDWEEVKDFQLAMFKSGLPNIDMPQDIAFIGVLYRFAARHGIKYILNGGNISTECVRYPLQYFYYADMMHIKDILRKFGTRPMHSYPFTSAFYRKVYMPLAHGVRMVKPLNLMPYVKEDAMRELTSVYDWKPYSQKHFESRFTRFYEGYWLPTRFGYDVRRVQFSSLILTGQMTREEALVSLENPPYEASLIEQDYSFVAKKLGISDDELRYYHEMPRKFYWDYRNAHRYYLLGERILAKVANTRRGGAY